MSKHKDHQKVADEVQDRLSGTNKEANLHEDEDDSKKRVKLLEKEVKMWHEKYVAMEKTWRNLAKETVGKEEADKLSKQLEG